MASRETITEEGHYFSEACSLNNDVVCLDEKLSGLLAKIDLNITENLSSLEHALNEVAEQFLTILLSLQVAPDKTIVETLCVAAAVAIIGAFSAYLFNLVHWRMVNKMQQETLVYMALLELIKEVETIAVDYWLQGYDIRREEEISANEVKIKSKLRLMLRYVKEIGAMRKNKRLTPHRGKTSEFAIDIFELITGGDFESIARNASRIKATQISYKCADIKATILSLNCRT